MIFIKQYNILKKNFKIKNIRIKNLLFQNKCNYWLKFIAILSKRVSLNILILKILKKKFIIYTLNYGKKIKTKNLWLI